MTLHVQDAGTWKQAANIYVRDAGIWKTVQSAYVRDAGTWKQFYLLFGGGDIVPWSVVAQVTASGFQTASFALTNGGGRTTLDSEFFGAKFWLNPQTGMNLYEVICSVTSGSLNGGVSSPTGTWLNMGSSYSWGVTRFSVQGVGTTSATIQLSFRRATDQVVVYTNSVTLNSTN